MFDYAQFFGDIKQLDFRPVYLLDFLMKLNPHMNYLSKKKINPLISLKTSYITGKFGGIKVNRLETIIILMTPITFMKITESILSLVLMN